MSTEIAIFYPALLQITGSPAVRVEGNTVGQCLDSLVKQYPGAKNWLFDGSGQVLEYVFVYVNFESAKKALLSDPVSGEDKLILALMVSGG
jgi:hypothetical protein